MLHFLQRKNVVRYTFYNEKMLNVTLFTAKKCDGGVEYSGKSEIFLIVFYRVSRASFYSIVEEDLLKS